MKIQNLPKAFQIILLSLLFSTSIVGNCSAKGTAGYIITTELDTLFGEININKFNQYSGAYLISGVNIESYHSQVSFKEYREQLYQIYEPIDIYGFGFTFKNIGYRFKSFQIKKRSIVKKERNHNRFLQLIYKGKGGIELYRDVSAIVTQPNNTVLFNNVYYLNNNSIGIKEVKSTRKLRILKDLLALYGVDHEFLNTMNSETKNKEIKTLLIAYDTWLDK